LSGRPTGEAYPFGRPVKPRPASAGARRKVLVLGAYPGALYVTWTPPAGTKGIRAIPVDDEPMPGWNGVDAGERVVEWSQAVGWKSSWGSIQAAQENGSYGVWVEQRVLQPLAVPAADTWITDCLNTYRASVAGAKRVADTYAPFAASVGLSPASLRSHPTETAIVGEALALHRMRLTNELNGASPDLVVTLGNAALRVLSALVDEGSRGRLPTKLSTARHLYGQRLHVQVGSCAFEWLPLAHPAAPDSYQGAHDRWLQGLAPSAPLTV
jgi:hypothetical protein